MGSTPALATEDIAMGLRVTVVSAKEKCFAETLETVGRIVARDEILVRPEIEGLLVSEVLVEDGARIKEGQVLARLSRADGQPGSPPAAATIKSPASGVVSYRGAQMHVVASARGEPLFRVIVAGELELQTEIPAQWVSKLAPNQSAAIEIPGRDVITGHVRSVPVVIDQKTQISTARIFLGDQKLPLGTFAKALVTVGESCGPSVPLSAVIYEANGAIVQVIRGNRIETRRVQVGLFSESKIEIRDGLKAGDVVVARAGAFLREGDPVRPVMVKDPSSNSAR
jgi:HlyD family secretion protein